MPELPEVETTRRGILPRLEGRRVTAVRVRDGRLRWPVTPGLAGLLEGQVLAGIDRRGKYLLFHFPAGTLLVHLGMSGSLRVVTSPAEPLRRHDHLDLRWDDGSLLCYHDPRRFGAVLWIGDAAASHPLLAGLGPEPLGPEFDGAYLYRRSRGRRAGVKQLLMDGEVVVGVGNIYANEALFLAGIDPRRRAGAIALARYQALAASVRRVLEAAIAQGGTTLRDYVDGNGRPGYFALSLAVYGRAGQPCTRCGTPVRMLRHAQRSTFYCPRCQR
ncbi:MAG: Formamidopyrimidine-DNA glycosylase [Pseudomonadales bacterium]|nr:Formamidopyrimidine-DNA glycosylase [Pseudomonadales bacterium]